MLIEEPVRVLLHFYPMNNAFRRKSALQDNRLLHEPSSNRSTIQSLWHESLP